MELLKILQMLFIFGVSACQARVISGSRQARLSLAEPMPYYYYNNIDGNPGSYSYGYDVTDPSTGNNQFRTEERYPNGTVVGTYGYVDSWGRPHRFKYIADERGYRVMRDRSSTYVGQTTPSATTAGNIPTESSVTWTRPPKTKKKNSNKNVNNIGLEKRKYETLYNNNLFVQPQYRPVHYLQTYG